MKDKNHDGTSNENDEEHEKRVIKRMVWHKDRLATAAGWTVDTVTNNDY